MESRTFLEALLPPDGHIVLGVLPTQSRADGKKPKLFHKFHTSIDSLMADAQAEQSKGRDVYVTPATFKTPGNRHASNAQQIKSLFLDLDVGEGGNKYADKKAAVAALTQFLKDSGLPKPTLVDSGGGVHVYWVLDEPAPITQWFPVAVRLKKLCKHFEFAIDPTVTADAARVMRLVGSKNLKREGKPVVVRTQGETVSLQAITEIIDGHLPKTSWLEVAKSEWMKTSNLASHTEVDPNRISLFRIIGTQALKGEGCHQLRTCIENQDTVSEPMWRAGLSIAWACDDGSDYIHKMSRNHPDYDFDTTVAKAMATKGPYKCETFDDLNPGPCKGCKHWGKITSPIQLGSTLRSAPALQGGYKPEQEPSQAPATGEVEKLTDEVPMVIPEYPEPYFRPNTGGLAVRIDPGDGTAPWANIITDTDFWVHGLVRESTGTVKIWFKTYHKVQGQSDFLIPHCTNQGGELFKYLEDYGLIFDKASEREIRTYVYKAIRKLNQTAPAMQAVNQFGWDANFSYFVIGERKYTTDGKVQYTPPSEYTQPLIGMYTPKGTLTQWKKAAGKYCSTHPSIMPYLTAILAGFASPLFTFTGKDGLLVALSHRDSGSGKTLAQMVGLSIFGQPKLGLLTVKDTPKSKIERMGVVSNMPVAFEEMTKMSVEALQVMTYGITEGRSGNQARQYGGGEKVSDRTWSLIATGSSNESIRNKLSSNGEGAFPEANLMRVLELESPKHFLFGATEGVEIERIIQNNYGVAGHVFLQKLLPNIDEVRADIQRIYDEVSAAPGITPRERFYTAGYTAMLYAATLVRQYGILDVPVEAWAQWMMQQITKNIDTIETMAADRGTVLGEFLRTYAAHMMRVTKSADSGKYVVVEADRVRSPVMIRYEEDRGVMCIPAKEFKKFCVDRGDDYAGVLEEYRKAGVLKESGSQPRRLLKIGRAHV